MTAETAAPRRRSRRPSVLHEIAERRAADIIAELGARTLPELRAEARAAAPPRDVVGRFARPGLHLIAEMKRSSPSAGVIGERVDVAARARAYEAGGASIISVLVEPHWFGGSIDDLRRVREATSLPILAKEFVVDPRQLPLVRAAGADAVLLLAALHPRGRLGRLVRAARRLGLEPLVEAHDARELDIALSTEARVVGINNRDLRSLEVDPTTSDRLRSAVPDDRLVVAESGVREPDTLRRWRAIGFDAALVGEDLMRSGEDHRAVESRVAAFVSAGASPAPGTDPAVDGRRPWQKICGITERSGLLAAIGAGVDAIGLNFVEGTPRVLEEGEAAALVAMARAATAPGDGPAIVGVFGGRPAAEVAAIASRLELDMVQLHGRAQPSDLEVIERPAIVVIHVDADDGPGGSVEDAVTAFGEEAAAWLAAPGVAGIILDARDASALGGTGRRASIEVARAIAREAPVILAGGLDASNVAEALVEIPAVGVDVSSGVEPRPRPSGRPPKDPFRVALFAKRAGWARLDLPTRAFGPEPVERGLLEPDDAGRWGVARDLGGRYVPETLMAALLDLETAYRELRRDRAFWAELRDLGHRYVGRPTPVYRADRLAAELGRRAGRDLGRLRLYLKREDLDHTGAHKINNALGQALLTQRLGKRRVIAETGAGQHGVATATACALLGMDCVVYMGAEDIRRQAPNVLRMRALGAEVREVTSGTATLKDAVNETMRDWVTNVETTHYVLGSAVGPHPFPAIVRDLQRVIGDEAAAQMVALEGRLPDIVMACVGGGSNAIGLMARFIGETDTRLIGVEAAGEGLHARHAAALGGGSPGILHGSRSYLLQDADGQVVEAHSISAGLDYPGIGPQLSAIYAAGRMGILSATDDEALEGVRLLTRTEGILPALEPAHAISALGDLVAGRTDLPTAEGNDVILLGLSGRGDKDIAAIEDRLMAGFDEG